MSGGNTFEKTFSRKKKDSREGEEREKPDIIECEQLVIALASHSQQSKTPKHPNNGDKPKNSAKNPEKDKKRKVADPSKPKQKPQNGGKEETQKQKIKVENGDVKICELKKRKGQNPTTSTPENDKNLGKIKKEGEEKGREESSECTFPTNRIVRIIKSEGWDYRLSQEAVFLINKATEKFIELCSEDAYDCAVQEKKNFVGYKHLSSAVGKEKRLDFLSDFVPEKITAEKALAERNPAKTLPG